MNKDRIGSGQRSEEGGFSLPVENEILMLKLRAEFGAECSTCSSDIPPALVNEFLKSVYEFEMKYSQSVSSVSIYEKVGSPDFRKAGELAEHELRDELKKIAAHLRKHGIQLDILGEYEDRVIYEFIIEEFLFHEIDDIGMPGYINHFCYEEFHPNHEMDIGERAREFISQWFSRELGEYSLQLGDPFILPDTRILSRERVLKKIRYLFEAYICFNNFAFSIDLLSFTWNDEKETGIAYVDGVVKYDAVTENRERLEFNGNFKLYFSNTNGWWSIFYFEFPGFSWAQV